MGVGEGGSTDPDRDTHTDTNTDTHFPHTRVHVPLHVSLALPVRGVQGHEGVAGSEGAGPLSEQHCGWGGGCDSKGGTWDGGHTNT